MYIPENDNNDVIEEIEEIDGAGEDGLDSDIDGDQDEVTEDESEDDDDDDENQGDPDDLADAFSRLRQMDKENSSDDVEGPGDDGSEDDEADDEDDEAADDEGYGDDRGSSDGNDPAEYQAARQNIIKSVNAIAMSKARKKFEDEGIREFTIGDIYQRTEDGRVIYNNPDDPKRPFSSRMEAQQWIDSFNRQVAQSMVSEARKYQKETMKSAAPMIRLMDFAPTYDQMDSDVRGVLDDLIEDYEVKTSDGRVIGYNCDLNKMAAKAYKLAEKYRHTSRSEKKKATMKKSPEQKRPALDARSRGSSQSGAGSSEPRSLQEAFGILRKMNNGRN